MATVNLNKIDNRTKVSLTKGATQKSLNDAVASAKQYRDEAEASIATTEANVGLTNADVAQAEIYKNQAGASASQASISASTATTQANIATTQAGISTVKAAEASDSATSALASATTATTKASEASVSATAAANSATVASASATAAETAEVNAETAQTEAESAKASAETAETNSVAAQLAAEAAQALAESAQSSATSSANSATASATSAGNSAASANTSATNAATSESNASSSATSASTSATTASNQASIATTKASEASVSANNAATSATNANNALSTFQGQYQSSTTEPSNPDVGDLWYDENVNFLKVYNGTIWDLAGSSVNGTSERQTYTATAGQASFNATYDIGFVDVYVNGLKLQETVDFTATNGTTVVLTSGANAGDVVDIVAYGTFEVADTYTQAQSDALLATKLEASDIAGKVDKVTSTDNSVPTFDGTTGAIQNKNAMFIDDAGNVLVGKTSVSFSTAGHELRPGSAAVFVRDGGDALSLNRLTSDGEIARFSKDGSTVGSIGARVGDLYLGTADTGITFTDSINAIRPVNTSTRLLSDGAIDIGSSSARFDDIYATNGTIQTSDQREKQDIAELDEAEQRVAVACKRLLRKFRWKDAVAERGDDARIHFGIIAQDLKSAFEAEGLDAGRYAMFIHSEWWETYIDVPAVEAVEAVEAVYDDKGNLVSEAVEAVEAREAYTQTDIFDTEAEAPEGATKCDRMGVRYPELLAFIIGAM